ncbi:MAG: hypothetical protein DI630_27315 [Gordonia sp. (in: high G+C Gram-positive bacteria)]|nr:MAG: hypothetical protein DI630_27315 [Gordonia sp. (in: high G+C Gram-positive bacteria)]
MLSETSGGPRQTVLAQYDVSHADQLTATRAKDIRPQGDESRRAFASLLTQLAVVYGLPSVYQYASMCASCAPRSAEEDWRVNVLSHERAIAGAGYQAFRVPNVDTLYSNAWLDLTDGPILLKLPDFGDRYYTLNFLDAYSNASNISGRTHPNNPRQVLVATTSWRGAPPEDVELFRVATPVMWLLMRIQVLNDADLPTVHQIQDAVAISGAVESTGRRWPVVSQPDVETSWEAFFIALDASLRINGIPGGDASHVAQFRQLGIADDDRCRPAGLDVSVAQGARDGFADAMALIKESRPLLGRRLSVGWTRVLDKGAHGTNFLARAVMNYVGLGANVVEENCSYNTYVDASGEKLNGSKGRVYRLEIGDPPPADAFWSITLYEAESGCLYDAPEGRHSVGSAMVPANDSGAVPVPTEICISEERPSVDGGALWLPSPGVEFFLVLRMYQPREEALTEKWTPPPVRREAR